MTNKEKITISIRKELLQKVDEKVDRVNFKNRSHVIESLVWEWLKLRQDLWAIIIANERKWNGWKYPLDIPKSLIKVDGKTLIEKHLQALKQANIEKCIIVVWHEKEQIKDFLKNKSFWVDVTFLDSDESDESQKVIYKCSKILKTNKCLVILWDNYFHNLNLTDFIYYHNTNSQYLSVIVKTIEASQGYGNIKLEGNNIIGFVEKPMHKEDISFIINAGVYLMNTEILHDVVENLKIEDNFFPDFVKTNRAKAYFHNWKWFHLQDDETLALFD